MLHQSICTAPGTKKVLSMVGIILSLPSFLGTPHMDSVDHQSLTGSIFILETPHLSTLKEHCLMAPVSCFKRSFTQKPPDTAVVPVTVDRAQAKGPGGPAADRLVFTVAGTP